MNAEPILSVRDLRTSFETERGTVRAVNGVSFDLLPGETLGVVGESGSGKSVMAMSLLNMVRRPGRIVGGSVDYRGKDIAVLDEAGLRQIRGSGLSMVFQDPMSSLDPIMTIRGQLVEAMVSHGKYTEEQAGERAVDLMARVGIPDPAARLGDYPHTYSGGMRQRVMIAMALANDPDVIIADEPTTALDVTIQAQILELLVELNRDLGTAIILITHNLGVVARVCQRVAVMYAGEIVEQGTAAELFAHPRHPYTRALLAATPRLAVESSRPLEAIPGRPPALIEPIPGCAFAPRCAYVDDVCHTRTPPVSSDGTSSWSCWRSKETGMLPPPPSVSEAEETVAAMALPDPNDASATPGGPAVPPLLEIVDVSKNFTVSRRAGFLRRETHQVSAADGITLDVRPGETVGIVGESGCGKSTLGKLVMGIHQPTGGRMFFDGHDLTAGSATDRQWFRRNVQLVFQDPMAALNPRLTVGEAVREPLEVHGLAKGKKARARVLELLDLVGLDESALDRYPHEFSGGQRQRVVIARALAVEPRLLVCDEAVAALDVSLQAQIVALLQRLQRELGLAYLFISHDLATVRHISHRIAVMYLGRFVEIGPADLVTGSPLHPYTAALMSAVPDPDPVTEATRERILLAGDVPSPLDPPPGCRFHTRCPIGPAVLPGRDICRTQAPGLGEGTHRAACHFAGELTLDLGRAQTSTERVS